MGSTQAGMNLIRGQCSNLIGLEGSKINRFHGRNLCCRQGNQLIRGQCVHLRSGQGNHLCRGQPSLNLSSGQSGYLGSCKGSNIDRFHHTDLGGGERNQLIRRQRIDLRCCQGN